MTEVTGLSLSPRPDLSVRPQSSCLDCGGSTGYRYQTTNIRNDDEGYRLEDTLWGIARGSGSEA
jgi:hypothetical protein